MLCTTRPPIHCTSRVICPGVLHTYRSAILVHIAVRSGCRYPSVLFRLPLSYLRCPCSSANTWNPDAALATSTGERFHGYPDGERLAPCHCLPGVDQIARPSTHPSTR